MKKRKSLTFFLERKSTTLFTFPSKTMFHPNRFDCVVCEDWVLVPQQKNLMSQVTKKHRMSMKRVIITIACQSIW